MINRISITAIVLLITFSWGIAQQKSFTNGSLGNELTPYGKIALAASKTTIHPGKPGETPYWNIAAVAFIYAPAFDFKSIDGATSYLYKITSKENDKVYTFKGKHPYDALSPVWAEVPVGKFNLQVIAFKTSGDSIGVAGKGDYYRAAPFNGIYHQPVMPYDKSAEIALEKLLSKSYVQYWLTNKQPDPTYLNYCYPAKIYSALVIGAVTYARLKPNTPEGAKAVQIAQTVADFMLSIRYERGSAWEYFVPTYYGKQYAPGPQAKPENNFVIMGVDAGNAFLDLYDLTKNTKYLEAAKKIADTYVKNQMANGSWYLFTNYKTNVPVVPNIAIPTAMLNYFDRLTIDYRVVGLAQTTKKAFDYIMENPVKTYDWSGQFEDITPHAPYKNLSREQACDFASYLMRHNNGDKKTIQIADDLIRFAEDQFVVWEKPRDKKPQKDGPGWIPTNWITPCVQEQYVFWNPVTRSAGVMIQTYWDAFAATHDDIYLAKAKSIANAITIAQKEHDGDYPSYLTKYKMPLWLNGVVYPAKTLMNLEHNINHN